MILWCGLIFYLSSQSQLPGPVDRTADFLLKKLGHLTVYAVLFRLVYRAIDPQTPRRLLKAFAFCILYALSDEYHQSLVPGRTPLLTDIGIDTLGMVSSAILMRNEKRIFAASR